MQISSLYKRKQLSSKCELKMCCLATVTYRASPHPSPTKATAEGWSWGQWMGLWTHWLGVLSLEWGAPSSPGMRPEGRTSEDAKFYGCLYPPQVVGGRGQDPTEQGTQEGTPPSHYPHGSSLRPLCPHGHVAIRGEVCLSSQGHPSWTSCVWARQWEDGSRGR